MTRTTFQEHARLHRKIINHDQAGRKVLCAWADCDRDAFSMHEVRTHEHARIIDCNSPMARHITYAFCTDRHRMYWLASSGAMAKDTEARNNGNIAGMLPPGYKGYMS